MKPFSLSRNPKIWDIVWDKNIKLWWHRLWLRKDEFHTSLSLDIMALSCMNKEERTSYEDDIAKRRQLAHERTRTKEGGLNDRLERSLE